IQSPGAAWPDSFAEIQGAVQMRGEIIQIALRHDAAFALEFARSSRLPAHSGALASDYITEHPQMQRYLSQMETQQEQAIATTAVAQDPKLAEQMAEESIQNGFSYSLINVLSLLRSKDLEAARKLAGAITDRLKSENLAANPDALNIAVGLINLDSPETQG